MLKLAEPHILSLDPYHPGRPIENDPSISVWAKLGSNENCFGPSKLAISAMLKSANEAHLYPNAKRFLVIDRLVTHLQEFSVTQKQIAIGNGTSELIVNLVRSLLAADEALLYCWPTFVMYPMAAASHGRERVAVPVMSDMAYDVELLVQIINDRQRNRPIKLVFLANPNNPTGKFLAHNELNYVVNKIPEDVVLVIDEAYFEYVTDDDFPNSLTHAVSRPRTIVLRTFSKIYGLAGLRLGYAVGDAHIIDLLCRIRDPFNVNSMVQSAALAALDDGEHVAKSIDHNNNMKPILVKGLKRFGFSVCEGSGNFVMAKRAENMPTVSEICHNLSLNGVLIRALHAFGLREWLRISVGLFHENNQLFDALEKVLSPSGESIVAT